MNRPGMSPMENFSADFIESVRCISVYQLSYILFKMYNAKPSVTNFMLHNFEGMGICHFGKDEKYVLAGRSNKNKVYKFDRKILMAIAVALETIEDPRDYKTIYVPNYGRETIRFMSGEKRYGVLINAEDNISSLLYHQEQYEDYMKAQAQKTNLDTKLIFDSRSRLMITYPIKSDIKTAFKNVEALDLTMPHSLCFLSGDSIYGEMKVKVLEPSA